MTKKSAISKMMKIEKLIKELKSEKNINVYSVENDILVLEYGDTMSYNSKAFDDEINFLSKQDANYHSHFSPKCKYDYTISLT